MVRITEEEYLEESELYRGICIKCGEFADQVEPDACNYKCENCGESEVFGLEEALMMGEIDIRD